MQLNVLGDPLQSMLQLKLNIRALKIWLGPTTIPYYPHFCSYVVTISLYTYMQICQFILSYVVLQQLKIVMVKSCHDDASLACIHNPKSVQEPDVLLLHICRQNASNTRLLAVGTHLLPFSNFLLICNRYNRYTISRWTIIMNLF